MRVSQRLPQSRHARRETGARPFGAALLVRIGAAEAFEAPRASPLPALRMFSIARPTPCNGGESIKESRMNGTNFGALLPVWLLGAPLVLAIIEKLRTPRVASYGGSTNLERSAGERVSSR